MSGQTEEVDRRLSIVLGHGASGTATSMKPWVDGLRARGIAARAIDLPRGKAERAVPVFRAVIDALSLAAAAESHAPRVVPGGHSFGGRVASLAAAEALEAGQPIAAVLLLSYPLHRPGDPSSWQARTAHWPALRCPVLLLSGESDPFARLELLREAVGRLPEGQLVTYPRVGHGLGPVLDDALDRAAAFVEGLAARTS